MARATLISRPHLFFRVYSGLDFICVGFAVSYRFFVAILTALVPRLVICIHAAFFSYLLIAFWELSYNLIHSFFYKSHFYKNGEGKGVFT